MLVPRVARQNVEYPNAEQAFRKYIELIPNDPNPYDSYAELLLKMGKYDEAKALYERGLKMTEDSRLSQEIKDNARLFHHYNLGRVAMLDRLSEFPETDTRLDSQSPNGANKCQQAEERFSNFQP